MLRWRILIYGIMAYSLWTFYSARPSIILPTIIGAAVLIAIVIWSKPANAD